MTASYLSDENENDAIRKDEKSEMDRNNSVNKELDEDSENDDKLRIKRYRVRNVFYFTKRSFS